MPHDPPALDGASSLIAERKEKLGTLRRLGPAFPNDFKPQHQAADLQHRHDGTPNDELESQALAKPSSASN